MYLNAVYTRVAAELSGLGKGLNDLVDLLLGHFRGGDLRIPAGRQGRRTCQLVAGVQDRFEQCPGEFILMQRSDQFCDGPATAHTSGKLHKQLGTGLMDLVHKLLQILKHLRILPKPLAPEGITQRCNTGNDQAYIVLRPLQEEFSSFLIKFTAGQFKPTEKRCTTHGAHHDSVFNFYITNLPRSKQRIVFLIHYIATFLCRF